MFRCDLCGKMFDRKGLWKRHMLSAHQEQAFTCSQCGSKFVDRMSLHVHESREHGHIAGSLPPSMQPAPVPVMLSENLPPLPPDGQNNKEQKVRKKMQYCEDCREHFTSKYDLLRHRVTTGHMGGAGGVCSDREEGIQLDQRAKPAKCIRSFQGDYSRFNNPFEPLQSPMRKAPPFMKVSEVSGVRRFRRMESLDDSAVPYIKTEAIDRDFLADRRHSAGALFLDSSDDCVVYSADGQQYTMKVSSSSDGGKDMDRESPA